VVEAKLRELERAVKSGFDPDEPRVPAGGPDGGQWTGGGGGGTSEAGSNTGVQAPTTGATTLEKIVTLARRVAAGSPLDYQRCLDLCYPLLERRQRPGSDRNKWNFHKCMNACLGLNL
jgi:hypothetical protein